MAELGAGVPDAADLAIGDINPANPHLYWQTFSSARGMTLGVLPSP